MRRGAGEHQPRKRFGQNFLRDPVYIQNIIQAIHPSPQDHILEIGPGQGALTTDLLALAGQLDCVEIDRDLAAKLQTQFSSNPKFHLHPMDILKFNLDRIASKTASLRIVGNLPYNITTPILFHLLKEHHLIRDMYFMLQKEVVDRITASPHHKSFGKLTLMLQYFCKAEALFVVPPQAFYPIPKVDSAVIRLTPYAKPRVPLDNFTLFRTMVSQAFNQRRKMLSTSLKVFMKAQDFADIEIDPKLRPEHLSLETWIKLCNFVNAKLRKQR